MFFVHSFKISSKMCELLKCIYTICIIFYSELMTSALYIDYQIMIFHLFNLMNNGRQGQLAADVLGQTLTLCEKTCDVKRLFARFHCIQFDAQLFVVPISCFCAFCLFRPKMISGTLVSGRVGTPKTKAQVLKGQKNNFAQNLFWLILGNF